MTFHCPGHDYPSLRQAMGRWWHHLSSVDSRSPVQIFAEQHQHERGLKSSEFSLLDLTTQCWHADGSNCFKFGEFFVVCPHVCQFGSFPTFRLLQISVEALIRISILHLWKLSCVINHCEYLRCFSLTIIVFSSSKLSTFFIPYFFRNPQVFPLKLLTFLSPISDDQCRRRNQRRCPLPIGSVQVETSKRSPLAGWVAR